MLTTRIQTIIPNEIKTIFPSTISTTILNKIIPSSSIQNTIRTTIATSIPKKFLVQFQLQ